LKADNIVLFGTGNETRDFIFISDIVQAIELVIKYSPGKFDIFNIANGVQISIKDAAAEFMNLVSFKGKVEFTGEVREGDPLRWEGDITKLKSIGYQPIFSFEQGIQKYIKWLGERQ
jgi:dTDP-glucose 4,6-dehydratase/UDP-glucose 4-epimerase